MTPDAVTVSVPVWLWVLASCGAVGAIGACIASIVGAVMQGNAAQKLEARRAAVGLRPFVLLFGYLLSCRQASRSDDPSAPTTTLVHRRVVECMNPVSVDLTVGQPEPSPRPIESREGHTDIYWWIPHGSVMTLDPVGRVDGNRIVIDPNARHHGGRGCPVQDVYRTRFPRVPAGDYELLLGAKTFPVLVPDGGR